MPHKQAEATVTPTTEEGKAVLLVAAYTRDRGGDVIQRGAFARTIAAWQGSGKRIPLAWDHETGKPDQLIGSVDPHSMVERSDGLRAEASLDLEGSAVAREAWRLIKSDSIGVSFGYLTEDVDTGNGTRLLTGIDLFEISLTATPMHPSTRVVSWKSEASLGEIRSHAELSAQVRRLQAEQEASEPAAKSTAPLRIASFDA